MSGQSFTDPLPAPTAGWDNGPSKLELKEREKQGQLEAFGPTDSHALSQIDHDEKGLAQKAGDTDEVTDVGWGHSPQGRIGAGLSNEDLWMLIRRFNKKPKAGVLGSHDSVTGAPEKMKGEAAEQEASNLIASAATVAVGSVAGKHDQGTPEGAPMEDSVPDAMHTVAEAADAQTAAHGGVPDSTHDKTREPMKETVLNGANIGMRIMSDITDIYEKLGNSLLKGIPTNAQLTLTLLRIGEKNAAPLPPPPADSLNKAPSHPASLNPSQVNLDASEEEITQAAAPDPIAQAQEEEEKSRAKKPKKTIGSRIVGFFRGTTATGIESKLAVDRVRAAAGSDHAKSRLGILSRKGKRALPSGPVRFDARYKGNRGAVVIDSALDPPVLYFTTDPDALLDDQRLESREKGTVSFTLPVTDIRELRKIGGLGWKGKLAAGWAVESKEVVDGLEIVGKDEKKQHYQLTAMKTRNQLFNRLVAIDGQVWESY
ncbi:unnamed protein product [Aspergillus oryzae]|nr:unnamed protein product [Aspergillus oryzae]